MLLKDKVVLITGAGHGIGRALAEQFHAAGAKGIAVADVDAKAAEEVAARIEGLALATDVSKESAIQRAVQATERRFGAIDLLCSNAGLAFSDAPGWAATSQTNAQWDYLWKVNVMAHVWGARAVLPGMIERRQGYLLNTVSAAGLLNQIGDAAYSTTKHAALGFAESLAITHGDQGIKVSVLCPQAVATRMFTSAEHAAAAEAASADGVLSPEEVAEVTLRGLEEEAFLILPHPRVSEYMQRKATDYDRWLGGMRRFRSRLFADDSNQGTEPR